MSTPVAALPKEQRLSISAITVTGTGTIPLLFNRFTPGCSALPIDIGAQVAGHGSLGQPIELIRDNIRVVAPRSSHRPCKPEMKELLKSIFNNSSAYTYSTASQGTKERSIVFDDTQTVWKIDGCVVSRAVIQAASGGEVTVDLEWAGKDFVDTGITYPTLALTNCLGPFWVFADAVVTIAGTTIKPRSIKHIFDNAISNDRYFYGPTSAGPVSTNRIASLELELPYGLHSGLRKSVNVDGGAAATVVYTNGTATMTFSYPAIRSASVSPESSVPDEVFMPFVAQAYDLRTPGSEATCCTVTFDS